MKYLRIDNGMVAEVSEIAPGAHDAENWVRCPGELVLSGDQGLLSYYNQKLDEMRAEFEKFDSNFVEILVEEALTETDLDNNGFVYGIDFVISDPPTVLALLEAHNTWSPETTLTSVEYYDTVDIEAINEEAAASKMSVLDFFERFSDSEITAIYTKAADGTPEGLQISIFIDKVKVSQEIDLKNTTLVSGMQALVDLSLITSDRRDVILS